jgi:hypothetical protein
MCDGNIGPGIDNYSPSPSAAIIDPSEMRYRQNLYYIPPALPWVDKEKVSIFKKIIRSISKILKHDPR